MLINELVRKDQKMPEELPIEVGIERAKREIVAAINQIGSNYGLPSSILMLVVEDVINNSKIGTYTTIISNYDISAKKPNQVTPIKKQPTKAPVKKMPVKAPTKTIVKKQQDE
jgi:hypothetical protein